VATTSVHMWKPGTSGLPSYLCGIEPDEVIAGVAVERMTPFPAKLLCGD
jgi:hypothetical protein